MTKKNNITSINYKVYYKPLTKVKNPFIEPIFHAIKF